MFYESCKKSLTEQKNNFNHSLKKCFDNFQFFEHEKNNDKETEEKSIFDFLSDGIYLLTMFFLIIFLFPFFVYIYLNLFYEKKPTVEQFVSIESYLQNDKSFHLIERLDSVHEDSSNLFNETTDENI
jgi:hypothetical protein